MAICNPLNIDYRFGRDDNAETGYREGSDPSVVHYQDRYWLFASKSGGYWHSTDLSAWTFVASEILESEHYGPDATVIDGRLIVSAHSPWDHDFVEHPVFASTDPLTDSWEKIATVPPHGDVCYFQDDDGRVYRYDGLSNKKPLYGCEVDRQTFQPLAERSELYDQDRATRGWEQNGDDHGLDSAAWIEGSWMTKHDGRYYLQYAAPGTTWNVYSDSVLVGDHPLGPFQLQDHNPMSYKPTGFATGAGHGSTFQDVHGNWWHASTMRISVRFWTERRIGLWPAGFDEDGILFCNTAFGDWPMRLPTGPWNPWTDAFAGWMLLSYQAPCAASSALPDHPVDNAVDEDLRTWWCAEDNDQPWLQVDLGQVSQVAAVQINFAEHDSRLKGRNHPELYHAYLIEASQNGSDWQLVVDKGENRQDVPHDFVELAQPAEARFLRLTILHVPDGLPAVAGFRVFGLAPGSAPAVPQLTRAERGEDRRTVSLAWPEQADAIGYAIWWGIAPDKLYNSCLVYGQNTLLLRCLHAERDYHVAIEAFNGSGRSALSRPQAI